MCLKESIGVLWTEESQQPIELRQAVQRKGSAKSARVLEGENKALTGLKPSTARSPLPAQAIGKRRVSCFKPQTKRGLVWHAMTKDQHGPLG